MSERSERVRLYSSWRGLLLAFFSPGALLLLGVLAMQRSGLRILPVILIVVGGGLLLVSLFDYPLHTTFDRDGVTRRTPLRAHRIPWLRVGAINRARGGRRGKRGGPLSAGVGRRKYLLVDRCEGAQEYEDLRSLLSQLEVHTPVIASAPAPETAPTWLYHRKPDPT